jgi:hypothetical protein
MSALLKIMPLIMSIFNRTRKLSGALKSKTTQTQWIATLIVCAVIAAVGAFVPALQDDVTAQGAALALIALLGPALSRLIGKIEKQPLQNAEIELLAVQLKDDVAAWRKFDGMVSEAKDKGYARGLSYKNIIYDLSTGEAIGERETPLRIPDGNPLEELFVKGIGKREPK